MTSLRSLRLVVGDGEAETTGDPPIAGSGKIKAAGRPPTKEIPINYDPLSRSVECLDVPFDLFDANDSSAEADHCIYYSPPMSLHIDQPGELYQQVSLAGQVEVDIPDWLLSGLRVRPFDTTGAPFRDLKPEMTTRLKIHFQLILDDAFTRRTLSPYQHLHFDGVIPDEMRIADIRTALVDRGFRIAQDQPLHRGPDSLKHYFRANRPEGPETMRLLMTIEGKRYTAERQTQLAGGQVYTSTVESGDLKVYMRGQLRSDSHDLVQEMNAIQAALRDRFERVRAKR